MLVRKTYLHELDHLQVFVPIQHIQVARKLEVLRPISNQLQQGCSSERVLQSLIDGLLHHPFRVHPAVGRRRLPLQQFQNLRLGVVSFLPFLRESRTVCRTIPLRRLYEVLRHRALHSMSSRRFHRLQIGARGRFCPKILHVFLLLLVPSHSLSDGLELLAAVVWLPFWESVPQFELVYVGYLQIGLRPLS